MIRVFNTRKWSELNEKQSLSYKSKRARLIKFEINAPTRVELYLSYPDGAYVDRLDSPGQLDEIIPPKKSFFLCTVQGRETVETFVDGRVDLYAANGKCYVYTADGDDVSSVVVDPVIYTRIAERKARNPEIEAIERRMFLNTERRIASQMDDMERRYGAILSAAEERAAHAEIRAKEAAKRAKSAPAPAGDSEGAQSSETPAKPAGSGGAGNETGKGGTASGSEGSKSGKG